MRLLPRMNDVFDDFFDDRFFAPSTNAMRTDIAEKDNSYVLNMELPGFNKEDVKVSLKDG
ncbi:MAG TPA: heat-shock protein Hsp20, partial [Erysipelotrichaceae bacterium]|nr:heat-shock protein Hsp20 [Erysipelotrichaceae bacterium]